MGEIADDCFDRAMDELFDPDSEWDFGRVFRGRARPPLQCQFCGSTDVRWRQQTGRWVLFSTTPGVEHNCRSQPASADEFDEVKP